MKKLATLTCSCEWRRIVHRAIKYWHSGMFCYHLVLMNHSWGKSKALRKMVHLFFGHNWQYFRAFQTCKRYWKSFHMTILKKIKFKWSTLGRCSQDEIFPVAIIRILRGKKPNDCRMMAETNLTEDGAQTKAVVGFSCDKKNWVFAL